MTSLRISHQSRAVVLAAVLLSSALSPAGSAAPDPTYRATVEEVRLTFVATDENNRILDALKPGDFAVIDDELVIRKFRSFTHSDESKLDITVLVDSSESVASRFRQEISDVLRLMADSKSITEDNVSVISFGGTRSTVICSGNCRQSSPVQQLFALSPQGATPLFDAVVFAAKQASERRDPLVRPVIILFSDGVDTVSRHSAADVAQAAIESNAQVYAVDLNKSGVRSKGTSTLQTLADATGGRYFTIGEGAVKVLGDVLEDLHAAYVVTYQLPSRDIGFHPVRILPTHNLNLRFRCRHGYYQRMVN